jgi:hypothetical protein
MNGKHEVRITKAEYGDTWPFSVDEGILRCEGIEGTGAVTFEAQGKTYALNGIAREQKAFLEVDPIWLPDPEAPAEFNLKMNLGPIIDRGLQLCD